MLKVDDSASTSFKVVDPNAFDISYLDGSQAQGDYVTDNFEIGGTSIKGLQMGFATDANLTRGIMGIGYTTNQASNDPRHPAPFTYPSIIDTMVEQKLISTKAYSLYLDDLQSSTGSIIFGGLDSDKYHGNLLEVPLVPAQFPNGSVIYTTFTVALTSFSITDENGAETQLTNSKRYPVVLDSGTTITYLPDTVAGRLYSAIGAVDDTENSGIVFADCKLNPSIKFNYQFGGSSGITIEVPLSELLFSIQDITGGSSGFLPNLPFSEPCAFGIFPDAGGPSILGDTFLRSAYVVYDISNDVVALAQTNFNSTTSSIVNFEASQTAIPNVSGVASTVDVTQTATGILGDGGGSVKSRTSGLSGTGTGDSGGSGPTATVTVTPSGNGAAATTTSTSSSTRNAGVKTMPAFDGRSTIVIGLWGAFALLGGALFLA